MCRPSRKSLYVCHVGVYSRLEEVLPGSECSTFWGPPPNTEAVRWCSFPNEAATALWGHLTCQVMQGREKFLHPEVRQNPSPHFCGAREASRPYHDGCALQPCTAAGHPGHWQVVHPGQPQEVVLSVHYVWLAAPFCTTVLFRHTSNHCPTRYPFTPGSRACTCRWSVLPEDTMPHQGPL